ncbi:MAG: triphosphoribosyl-dephospho-CoA synthase [Bacteroidales bacterium]|nr:triphosphoribosyl-dephospho-CoA synthase [Bacteroidales bacterium]
MMETFEGIEIEELPLGVPRFRNKVESFLKDNGLALEEVDLYLAACDSDGSILAGGGLWRDTIKCVAVSEKTRARGLATPLISRLIALGADRGFTSLRVFTKPENRKIFESLGFRLAASAPKAILMTSGISVPRQEAPGPVVARDHPCKGKCPLRGLTGGRTNSRLAWRGPTFGWEGWSEAEGSGCLLPEDASLSYRPSEASGEISSAGIIVMNANPFTLGHRYLAEQAAGRCERLYVLVVREEASRFPFEERFAMVQAGLADIPNVVVCDGGTDVISRSVFPTYFLKDLSDAAPTQMALDLDLFCRSVAPSYGATMRFVGSEPTDALTAEYNRMMKEILPARGIEVVEIPRLEADGSPVSASTVRELLDCSGTAVRVSRLVPTTTLPYLLADLACTALEEELHTPGKPGLVGPDGPGAHKDMDLALMEKSIRAIRPYFSQISQLALEGRWRMTPGPVAAHGYPRKGKCPLWGLTGGRTNSRRAGRGPTSGWEGWSEAEGSGSHTLAANLIEIGLEAERAMLEATGGVNTHRGAIFSLGLAVFAAASLWGCGAQVPNTEELMQFWCGEIATLIMRKQFEHSEIRSTAHFKDARAMACGGYAELFSDWLPNYRREHSALKTLLLIMSTLDDTCVIRRAGKERALQVKREAMAALEEMAVRESRHWLPKREGTHEVGRIGAAELPSPEGVKELCQRYAAEGISPGGAADMLALTLFMDRIIPQKDKN